MAWIMGTFLVTAGYSVPGVVTGEPVSIGGSRGRAGATSRGVTITALAALARHAIPGEGRRVAVQGSVTSALGAQYLADAGCQVVAVCDVTGGRYGECGLELDVDLLVPAALEEVITADNADRVRARFVVEGANGPTTPEADAILAARGCIVVPDILANAWGVVVSYLEWVQNLQAYSWSETEVAHRLHDLLRRAFDDVAELADDRGLTLREAAHATGVGRVAHAPATRSLPLIDPKPSEGCCARR
jgi:glutamate dehydrogenase (NAD(P)+)